MNKKTYIFLLLIFVALNPGCKKNPFDYRTKYIGNYDFVNSWHSWTMGGPVNSGTTYTEGKVEYGEKGCINVTFDNNSPSFVQEFAVNRDGYLSDSNGKNVGTISKKKLSYTSPGTGGLGGGSTSSISGTKK